MTGQADGVALDVEGLRDAAELLRSSAPAVGETTSAAGRALDDAGAATGQPALSTALAELTRRWGEGVGPVAGRVGGYGVMLHASVEAHVATDEAGAAVLDPPR